MIPILIPLSGRNVCDQLEVMLQPHISSSPSHNVERNREQPLSSHACGTRPTSYCSPIVGNAAALVPVPNEDSYLASLSGTRYCFDGVEYLFHRHRYQQLLMLPPPRIPRLLTNIQWQLVSRSRQLHRPVVYPFQAFVIGISLVPPPCELTTTDPAVFQRRPPQCPLPVSSRLVHPRNLKILRTPAARGSTSSKPLMSPGDL